MSAQYPESTLPYGFVQHNIDEVDSEEIMQMHRQGMSAYKISREIGIGIERVKRLIRINNEK